MREQNLLRAVGIALLLAPCLVALGWSFLVLLSVAQGMHVDL